MNNDKYNSKIISSITIEPDIYLTDREQIYFDRCLSNLFDICHLPITLNCTLLSVSSLSNLTNTNREVVRMNHYLRVRQPQKFYWMRNIKQMYLNLRFPTNEAEPMTGNLIEYHSCKRLPSTARTTVQQIKPILLIYYVEERSLKLNIRGVNCLLQLIFSSDDQDNDKGNVRKGVYYKWSDEGHIRSTTIQFDIDYQIEKELLLI